MTAIAIIPARGGSRRIPRKNIREFHGKPIIAYSIEVALASGLFQQVLVSTDDQEIFNVAEDYGAEGYMRAPRYGKDEVGTQEVVRECLETINYNGDYACCIYATAPFVRAEDLHMGAVILRDEPRTIYVFTVGTKSACIYDAGQWYFGRASAFRAGTPLVDVWTRVYPVRDDRACDINTEADWERAEQMYQKLKDRRQAA